MTPASAIRPAFETVKETDAKPSALIVDTYDASFVLPWYRMEFAALVGSTLQITFTSHIVAVTGHNLRQLLSTVASHRLVSLSSPTQNEARFASGAGPRIESVSVAEIDPDSE